VEGAAEHVLHREVVHRLRLDPAVGALGRVGAVDELLADGEGESGELVGGRRLVELEAAEVTEVVEEPLLERPSRRDRGSGACAQRDPPPLGAGNVFAPGCERAVYDATLTIPVAVERRRAKG
jgi:hypothetical protein